MEHLRHESKRAPTRAIVVLLGRRDTSRKLALTIERMSTYTVTEDADHLIFWVCEDGQMRWAFHSRAEAERKSRSENAKGRLEAMLALLGEAKPSSDNELWIVKRDALIEKINR